VSGSCDLAQTGRKPAVVLRDPAKNKGTTGETKEKAKGEAKAEEVKTSF
jgi:hypothetical protein